MEIKASRQSIKYDKEQADHGEQIPYDPDKHMGYRALQHGHIIDYVGNQLTGRVLLKKAEAQGIEMLIDGHPQVTNNTLSD